MNRRLLLPAISPAIVLSLLTLPLSAQDWPQWRGPNRDGALASFREPSPWPEPREGVPPLIRIARVGDYRTHSIGRFAGGQFYGDELFDPKSDGVGHGTVVLHRVDDRGHHLGSTVRTKVPYELTEEQLSVLLAELPQWSYADIAIRPFRVELAGVIHELVDQSEDHGAPRVGLYPQDLMFTPPWDGSYST